MIHSIWYHVHEKEPEKSGMYLAYKSYTFGDDDIEVRYYYFDKSKTMSKWRASYSGYGENVLCWCDVQFDDDEIRKFKPIENIALINAFDNVCKAIDQYEVIKALVI